MNIIITDIFDPSVTKVYTSNGRITNFNFSALEDYVVYTEKNILKSLVISH